MKVLTDQAQLKCGHDGFVANRSSQGYVTIMGRPILIEPDPEGRDITACPSIAAQSKPCTTTLGVRTGYSTLVRISGHPICLDSVVGFTNGTPPGTIDYTVRLPGQHLVESWA